MGLENLAATQKEQVARLKVTVSEDEARVSQMMSDAKQIFGAVRTASTVRHIAS